MMDILTLKIRFKYVFGLYNRISLIYGRKYKFILV